MRRLTLAAVVSSAVAATFFALAMTGCDQLNKPIGSPSSSSSSSSGGASTRGDGGDLSDEGGASPAPTITAQPGDIQL